MKADNISGRAVKPTVAEPRDTHDTIWTSPSTCPRRKGDYMATDEKLSATGTGSQRAFIIQIINLSGTSVSVSSAQLTGGDWVRPGLDRKSVV